jgi:hypothetical protein
MKSNQIGINQIAYDMRGNAVHQSAVPQPTEPNIFFQVEGLLKWLDTAGSLCQQFQNDVFGVLAAVAPEQSKALGLELMLANACSKAACLVGELRTINQRMGCKEI